MNDYNSFCCCYTMNRGSVLPYMVAWILYQGTLLMTVLNFTGLFINGLVCFVLPLLLVLKAMECSSSSSNQQYINIDELVEPIGDDHDDDDDDDNDDGLADDKEAVHPLSPSIEPYRKSIALLLLIFFAIIVIWSSCLMIIGGQGQSS